MVQVKFYILQMYDKSQKHIGEISDKLYCQITNIHDLSKEEDFDVLISTIMKAKKDFVEYHQHISPFLVTDSNSNRIL